MQPVHYPVGPSCMVKDVTNGALQVVPAIPFRCEGNLFYRLVINGAFVSYQPNYKYLCCEARKITLRQHENEFIAKIKFTNNTTVEVLRINPNTREILQVSLL